MQYADVSGERREAFKGGRGLCPVCQTKTIAKVGSLKIPHWSHESLTDCDRFSEPETEWHRAWKSFFPPECREVVVGRNRADVITCGPMGRFVLEFQNSPISREKILDRQQAYGDSLIWIINGGTLAKHADFKPRFSQGEWVSRRVIDYSLWWKWGSGLWAGQRVWIHYDSNQPRLYRLEPNTLKRDWAGSLVGQHISVWDDLKELLPLIGGGFSHGALGWAERLKKHVEYCELYPDFGCY